MLWIPVAFVCLTNGVCAFHHTFVERYLQECEAVNKKAEIAMRADPDVTAFQTTCIEMKPKGKTDATFQVIQFKRTDKIGHGATA